MEFRLNVRDQICRRNFAIWRFCHSYQGRNDDFIFFNRHMLVFLGLFLDVLYTPYSQNTNFRTISQILILFDYGGYWSLRVGWTNKGPSEIFFYFTSCLNSDRLLSRP